MYVRFLCSASKEAYTFAKICKRHCTLDEFSEKHQPWMFPKMFSRCCESIIMEITYKCTSSVVNWPCSEFFWLVITFTSLDTKLEEKFGRYLGFDRAFKWIEVLVFNFPAKLLLLRLLHQQKFNFVFRKSNRLCFTFTGKQISFLSYRNLIIWVFFIVIGCLWIISQQGKVFESL